MVVPDESRRQNGLEAVAVAAVPPGVANAGLSGSRELRSGG